MASTVRQDIVTALIARLQGILVSGGYATDAGENVFEWPDAPLDEADEVPGIVVRDESTAMERETAEEDIHHMQVSMECLAKGTLAPAEVRKIMGDVLKAIRSDLTFGGLARDTQVEEHRMSEVSQEDRKLGGGRVTVVIQYETDHFYM